MPLIKPLEQENNQVSKPAEDAVGAVPGTMPNFVVQGMNKVAQQNQTIPQNNVDPSKLNFSFNPSVGIYSFFDVAIANAASDIHLGNGFPPLLRVNGKLIKIAGSEVLNSDSIETMVLKLIGEDNFKRLQSNKELDMSINYKNGVRFRSNMYYKSGTIAAAFRLINSEIKTIEELYLPQIFHEFIKLPHGLILVTGPTGSGKSTTLAAMINELNLSKSKHIITIEDPIEYVYPKALSLIDQREVGRDTLSWKNALRATLRQDPDVVLVGEMRDYETIASTITIAETGHLVLSTLHTNSASQAIDRIIDVFPEHQQSQVRNQLANVLSAVISQRLVPLNNGTRRAAIEVLLGNSAVKNAIREGKTYQIDNMIYTGGSIGMISLEKSIAELVKSGLISLENALNYTVHPDELKQMMGV
jgi:twitching motility protein PilT